MAGTSFTKKITKLFGNRNDRIIKVYRKRVEAINMLEPEIRKLSDEQMRERAQSLRERLAKGEDDLAILPEAFALMRESMDRNIGLRKALDPANNFNIDLLPPAARDLYTDVRFKCVTETDWMFVDIPVELYDAIRAVVPADRPPFRGRPFDVQLIGGMVLYEGKIAEMATGEGKTFVGPLAAFMMALRGKHCHVITVNDYLVRRDAAWVAPAFYAMGMSVGYIQAFMDNATKKRAYECNVTYGTNSEFGFDYLRDNMKLSVAEQVQGPLQYAIIDEVDSILIDEARVPLIISGPAHDDAPKYAAADEVARKIIQASNGWNQANEAVENLKRRIKGLEGDLKNSRNDASKQQQLKAALQEMPQAEARLAKHVQLYEIEMDRKAALLTHEGIQKAQEFAGVGSFYVGSNMDWPHLLEQALRAHVIYERDKDYVVENGEVVIVDEFTGRKQIGRQWSDGLHQAIEAKEKVQIKPETQTMGTVTLQNFSKLYWRQAGMTGTAMTEADEFMKIYKLDVVQIPTNKPCIRKDQDDFIYMNEKAKWNAIVEKIHELHESGQPVLVGTTSVEKSERLSRMLTERYGIEHSVLNAKNHDREATIVVQAGEQYTDSKGRKVGRVTIATNMAGRGTDIKLSPGVPEVGGLYVLGTERHESRRVDNQLRGRSGRQGDPGESRFFLSLDDELMKLFAGGFTLRALQRLGMQEDEAIEHPWVSKAVVKAQKKVEERNFGIRKNLLEYDEVNDHQRKYFYGLRQQTLEGQNLRSVIFDLISDAVSDAVYEYMDPGYIPGKVAEWVRTTFNITVDPADLRENSLEMLAHTIKGICQDEVRNSITTSLDEFMDPDADPNDWDTNQLAEWARTQFKVQVTGEQLKQMDRAQIQEALVDAALDRIERTDCTGVEKYLEPGFALKQLAAWAHDKFGMTVADDALAGKDAAQITELIMDQALALYERRELEYPIEYAIEATMGSGGTENIYASEQLAAWVTGKFGIAITGDEIRALPLDKLHARLLEIAGQAPKQLDKEVAEAVERLTAAKELRAWAEHRFHTPADPQLFDDETPTQRKEYLMETGRAFLRSELTTMERAVLLQIFDATWKDHLYAMDQLRAGIGLQAFAERDPRVEFQRTGSLLFREFQKTIRDKVTDIIFKVRAGQNFAPQNVYAQTTEEPTEEQSYGVGQSAAAQQARADRMDTVAADLRDNKPEPRAQTVVNEQPKVGRNDPCPCGSGKKYKQCCGKVA